MATGRPMRKSEGISIIVGALHDFLDWPDQYIEHGWGTEKDAWLDYHNLAIKVMDTILEATNTEHQPGKKPGPRQGGLTMLVLDGTSDEP